MTKPVFNCLLGAVQTLVSVLFLRMIDQVNEIIKYQILKSFMSLSWGITIVIVCVLADCIVDSDFNSRKDAKVVGPGRRVLVFCFFGVLSLGCCWLLDQGAAWWRQMGLAVTAGAS